MKNNINYQSKILFLSFLLLSGFCALTYEIIWFRKLRLILGSDSIAIALILAAFMAGMGIGNLFFGFLADRKSPLKIYRYLELSIGIYGIISIWFVQIFNIPYKMLYNSFFEKEFILFLSKFLISFLFFFVPCVLMGGTFPTAVKFLITKNIIKTSSVSLSYGINTLGACFGTISVPFIFLSHVNQNLLLFIAAIINILIFIGTFAIPDIKKSHERKKSEPKDESIGKFGFLPLILFITGFVSISLETIWNRIFSFYFTSSVYLFSLILFTFLIFVALGSLSLNLKKLKSYSSEKIFAFSQAVVTLLIIFQVVYLDKIYLIQLKILSFFDLNFTSYILTSLVIFIFSIGPIAFCFGLSFPSAISYIANNIKKIGFQSGYLTAINTIGTSISSLFVTFLGFRLFGSKNLLILMAFLSLINYLIIVIKEKFSMKAFFVILVLTVSPALSFKWDYRNFHLLLCQKPEWTIENYKEKKLEEYKNNLNILAVKEDYEAFTSVADVKNTARNLYINGKPDAGTHPNDIMTQYLSGIIPYLYLPVDIKPKVFILGLGSGSTTYAASLFEHEELISVEISPSVVYLADKFFTEINYGAVQKTKIKIDDGRNYLQNSKTKYDIIISEPSNPWISGTANLFTKDFFKIVYSHLTDRGIFCQWFYYYKMDYKYVIGLIKTLNKVFPYINIYNLTGDIIMIASKEPLEIKRNIFDLQNENVIETFKKINIKSPELFFNYFMWNSEQINQLNSNFSPNKDEKNWLEFQAQKYIFKDYTEYNLSKIYNTYNSSIIPYNLSYQIKNNNYFFKEIGLKLFDLQNWKNINYYLEKKYYISKKLFENSFYKIEATDNLSSELMIYSPLIDRAVSIDFGKYIILLETKEWKKTSFLQLNSPEHIYYTVISEHYPFQFSAFWNCEKSNKSFFIILKNFNTKLDQNAIINTLEKILCH